MQTGSQMSVVNDENQKNPPYDARGIANFILDYADMKNQKLTNMQLLKLIYLAHVRCLETKDRPLIDNVIKAWKYGPVIQSVYECFKHIKDQPIEIRAYSKNYLTGELKEVRTNINAESSQIVIDTYNQFGHLSAFELSNITHHQTGAWHRVWNDETDSLCMTITNEEILKLIRPQEVH